MTLVSDWITVMCSVKASHILGRVHPTRVHMSRSVVIERDTARCSESFIDTEYKRVFAFADAEVEAHVGALLEFPAVAYASVGEEAAELNI